MFEKFHCQYCVAQETGIHITANVLLRCLKQTLWCSVVQMIFDSGVCHVPMLPFRWEQRGDSCSYVGHRGVYKKRFLDCCVIDVASLVGAPSVG